MVRIGYYVIIASILDPSLNPFSPKPFYLPTPKTRCSCNLNFDLEEAVNLEGSARGQVEDDDPLSYLQDTDFEGSDPESNGSEDGDEAENDHVTARGHEGNCRRIQTWSQGGVLPGMPNAGAFALAFLAPGDRIQLGFKRCLKSHMRTTK